MQQFSKKQKIVIGMVGLPARGKTYISRKICRYLSWLGYKCKVFNIGNYRRQLCGTDCDSNFFDPKNNEAVKARDDCAKLALKDMVDYLKEDGDVSIYDGTNTTHARREMVTMTLKENFPELQVFWIESICNDQDVIERNIRLTKLNNPDYKDKEPEVATNDFLNRIQMYQQQYQPIEEAENIPFIKLIDIGREMILYNVRGYIQSKVISFLMNLHIYPRPIFFSRHGESVYNSLHKVGGDSELTELGQQYAKRLGEFFEQEFGDQKDQKDLKMYTSTMQRALQTTTEVSNRLGIEFLSVKSLDEINAGICDGLTYKQIAEKFPEDYEERKMNKLTYRYPRGESYLDLISRVEPVIFEIERSRIPVIVIAHQAILRCLYAYFHEHDIPDVPSLNIPLHHVIKLVPSTYSCKEVRINIDPITGKQEIIDHTQMKKTRSFLEL